jgi:pilus assembly protein Flp/PilA
MRFVRHYLHATSGATSIEYAIIAAGIALAIAAVVGTLSTQVQTTYQNVANALSNGR